MSINKMCLGLIYDFVLWLIGLFRYKREAPPAQRSENFSPDIFASSTPSVPNLEAISQVEAKKSKDMKNSTLYVHKNFKRSELAKPPLVKGNAKMGLQNTGLTCYFNSAINSLYFVPQFYRFFSAEKQPSDLPLLSRLEQFVRIYGQMNVPSSLLASIRYAVPSFRHEGMGSAYEFILGLLQCADEEVGSYVEMDSVPPGEKWERELARRKLSGCQPLHKIFSVVVEETLTCTKCYNFFSRYLYNRSFSIDLGESIENCLTNYLSEEKRSEPYYCTCKVCKTAEVHTIKRSLKHIGSAIIIHLQRHHSSTPYTKVEIPESLNMSTYLQGAGTYWLCSAVHHSGTVESGHYTSYARTESGWMCFDDSYASFEPKVPRRLLRASTFFIYASA